MRCVVAASPPANIDWLKESAIISSGGFCGIGGGGLSINHGICGHFASGCHIGGGVASGGGIGGGCAN